MFHNTQFFKCSTGSVCTNLAVVHSFTVSHKKKLCAMYFIFQAADKISGKKVYTNNQQN